MKKSISVITMITMILFMASMAGAGTYNGQEIPQGDIAFVDSVVVAQTDIKSEVAAAYRDPDAALRIPDFDEGTGAGQVSLGDGGVIVLEFTDNSLTTSGNSDDDLWIFEVGVVEPANISISKNGTDWIDVGSIAGATSGVDIDKYLNSGVELWGKYSYVKIEDALGYETTGTPFPGVDVDAVAAISSDAPVGTEDSPTAVIENEKSVGEGTTVYLYGGSSVPPADETITGWEWTQLSGTTVALTGDDTATAYFTTPATAPEAFTFQLTVTGSNSTTASATTIVNVIDGQEVPYAAINPRNQTVDEGATATLISNSSDKDGTVVGWLWEQVSGTAATLTTTDTNTLSFTAPAVGASGDTLTFKLTITDDSGLKDMTTATVSVVKAEITNTAPVADAGDDQTVAPGDTVTLDGTGSSDSDTGDAIASYRWTKISGPDVTLTGATTASPTFTAPATTGAIELQLTVTDNGSLQGTDTVIINVTDSSNTAPTAAAGDDQSVAAGATVTLDGSASADTEDTTVTSYFWAQISGTPVELSDPSAAQPTFTAPSASTSDTLVFELTVADSEGLKGTDSVSIAVAAVPAAGGGDSGGGCFISNTMGW